MPDAAVTSSTAVTTYRCEHAWLGGPAATADVTITVAGGEIVGIAVDTATSADVELPGITLPGAANAHSHAFHRLLRGSTQHGDGTFWTWRRQMYAVAADLTPERYLDVATAVYAEMVLAGYTCVGEFHYLHHRPDGSAYDQPNAMGAALATAARRAGIRLTLLDACYLRGGLAADGADVALDPVQRRFSDGTAAAWARRVTAAAADLAAPTVRVGAAVHSVRAVGADDIATVARWAADHHAPLHAHVSEQPAENDACRARHGQTPLGVFAATGAVDPGFTAVHATHVDDDDIAVLAGSGATACFCPTTERDLADGIGPSAALVAADVDLCIGSDSQAIVDSFEETRAVELDHRLASGRRGTHSIEALHTMRSVNGYRALGWPTGGRLAVGAPADFVSVRLDSVRTVAAGEPLAAALYAATAADVDHVVVDGDVVVRGGRHVAIDPVALLNDAVAAR